MKIEEQREAGGLNRLRVIARLAIGWRGPPVTLSIPATALILAANYTSHITTHFKNSSKF